MGKALLKVVLKLITSILSIILIPINALVVGLIPNFSTYITIFNNSVARFMGNSLSWFFNLLPPNTKQLIFVYISFLLIYYSVMYSAHLVYKVFIIIRRIKFW